MGLFASVTRTIAVAIGFFMSTASAPLLQGCGGGEDSKCCRVCDAGKACGDTCIDASLTCSAPSGCACNK